MKACLGTYCGFLLGILTVLLIYPVLVPAAQAEYVYVDLESAPSITVTDKAYLLEDTGGSLTIEDVLTPEISKKFNPIGSESLNLGYKKTVYWIKLTLANRNLSPQPGILEYSTDKPGKTVSFHIVKKDGRYTTVNGENFPKFPKIALPFHLRGKETITVYSRIENKTYLPLKLVLYSRDGFRQSSENEYLFFGFVAGTVCILIIYNLALLFSFRDVSYWFFTILLAAFLAWRAVQDGFIFVLFPVLDHLDAGLYISTPLLMTIALLLFTRSYLRLSEFRPWLDRYVIALIGITAFGTVLSLLLDAEIFMLFRNLLSLIAAISVIVIGPLVYLKGYRPALFFIIGMLGSMLSGLLSLIASFDIILTSVITENSTAVGNLFLFVCFSFGLTARVNDTRREKEAAQEKIIEVMASTEKLKDEFLANTSHELRTPLNGIIGIADSLIIGAAGKLAEPVLENLRLIVHSGKRLANLVNDILDFSRLKNRELRLHKNPVNIRQVVNLVIPFCRPLVKNQSIRITNIIPDDIPPVFGDEDRLQQIVYNLVGNAVKFTDEGSITVSAAELGEVVQVTVADTGIGIPADQITGIFNEFVQIDSAADRRFEGVGIGLSITRQLIELHGGKIRIESTPGKGTQAIFTIPTATGVEEADEIMEPEAEKTSRLPYLPVEEVPASLPETVENVTHDGSLVLVVDDDPVNLTVMVNQLSISRFNVITAKNGRDALGIIKGEQPPDLVLLDLMMPDMTGLEVMEEVRKKQSILDLPIIVISAKNRVIDFMQAISAGANDYLAKPVNTEELRTRLTLHDDFLKQTKELNRYREHLEAMVNARTADLNRTLEKVDEARRLAEEANKAKSEFLSNVTHDLRSPIQGILGFSQLGLMKGETLAQDDATEFFEAIDESGRRLLKLVNNLLDLSKLESGKADYRFDFFPLSVVVQSVNSECYALLLEKNIKLESKFSSFEVSVEMDVDRMAQVLHNLVSNAIKFSPLGAKVHIECVTDERSVTISVIDNGIGIPEDELEKVFEKFAQSSRSTSGYGGTGLGLSICREIVEAHQGRIWAEPNPEGGTMFTLSIPILQPVPEEEPAT